MELSGDVAPKQSLNKENHVWRLQSESSFNKSEEDLQDGELYKYIKIQIEVEDTGVGIKKSNLSKLFMDFGKLDEHSKINA